MTRARIDWEAVRERLRASERALNAALSENPERIDAAYRARAARMAEKGANRAVRKPGQAVLVFRLGQERYAIEMQEIAEVLPLGGCTPAPGSPPCFAGVINVRGELRAVLDLARLLALSGGPPDDTYFVLLLRRRVPEIGLKVGRIDEVREIRPEELPPESAGKYARGVAPGPLVLLNLDAVMARIDSREEV